MLRSRHAPPHLRRVLGGGLLTVIAPASEPAVLYISPRAGVAMRRYDQSAFVDGRGTRILRCFSQNRNCGQESLQPAFATRMANPMPASLLPAPASWPLRVLYADDMPALRDLMSDRLALDGHQVETAADGEEALARLIRASNAFDLIITDHNMPRVDGLDLVWHIRQLAYAGKIVVLSSELSPAVDERYRRFGVDLVLTKPIFPPTFCQRLRQLFFPADAAGSDPRTHSAAGTGPAETGHAAFRRAVRG